MNLLRIPPKLYFKRGCLPVALREMKEVYDLNGAYIITSPWALVNTSPWTRNCPLTT